MTHVIHWPLTCTPLPGYGINLRIFWWHMSSTDLWPALFLLQAMHAVESSILINFFPVILNQLFKLLSFSQMEDLQKNIVRWAKTKTLYLIIFFIFLSAVQVFGCKKKQAIPLIWILKVMKIPKIKRNESMFYYFLLPFFLSVALG